MEQRMKKEEKEYLKRIIVREFNKLYKRHRFKLTKKQEEYIIKYIGKALTEKVNSYLIKNEDRIKILEDLSINLLSLKRFEILERDVKALKEAWKYSLEYKDGVIIPEKRSKDKKLIKDVLTRYDNLSENGKNIC